MLLFSSVACLAWWFTSLHICSHRLKWPVLFFQPKTMSGQTTSQTVASGPILCGCLHQSMWVVFCFGGVVVVVTDQMNTSLGLSHAYTSAAGHSCKPYLSTANSCKCNNYYVFIYTHTCIDRHIHTVHSSGSFWEIRCSAQQDVHFPQLVLVRVITNMCTGIHTYR